MTAIKEPGYQQAEPAWDVARLFPAQGNWSAEEYLALETNHLVEFSQGNLEILEMPSETHQELVFLLAQMLRAFVTAKKLGKVLIAPFPIQLWPGKFREPDVSFLLTDHAGRRKAKFWIGADLVMEVLSSDRNRDLVTKRREYAQAGIPEYWIVDPEQQAITVLTLNGDSYNVHGNFRRGEKAASVLLNGFQIETDDLFA